MKCLDFRIWIVAHQCVSKRVRQMTQFRDIFLIFSHPSPFWPSLSLLYQLCANFPSSSSHPRSPNIGSVFYKPLCLRKMTRFPLTLLSASLFPYKFRKMGHCQEEQVCCETHLSKGYLIAAETKCSKWLLHAVLKHEFLFCFFTKAGHYVQTWTNISPLASILCINVDRNCPKENGVTADLIPSRQYGNSCFWTITEGKWGEVT